VELDEIVVRFMMGQSLVFGVFASSCNEARCIFLGFMDLVYFGVPQSPTKAILAHRY
jgi:hypothetical protein